MHFSDLTSDNEPAIQQAAEFLVDLLPEGWPAMDEAPKEARACVAPDKIARMALDGETVLGWIGWQERYAGHVWELHPLVVQGIGRALVEGLQEQVQARAAQHHLPRSRRRA